MARRRRAANLPLLRRPRACGQTEWRRVVFGRASGRRGVHGGGMIWAVSHPPKRTGEPVSRPIRSGRRRYAADTHPERIPHVSVSDTYPTRIRVPCTYRGNRGFKNMIICCQICMECIVWTYKNFRQLLTKPMTSCASRILFHA